MKVKKLEWYTVFCEREGWGCRNPNVCGYEAFLPNNVYEYEGITYRIDTDIAGSIYVASVIYTDGWCEKVSGFSKVSCETLEEAKQVCQKHFEAAIMACMEEE